jgi:diaminopimelate epimerase
MRTTKNTDVAFAKFHGLGNDFIVVGAEGLPRSLPKFVTRILDRHTGIGADGLLVAMRPHNKKHEARVRFFNPDGSEAEMSGNGIRCAGAFLAGLFPRKQIFLIETAAGVKSLEKVGAGVHKNAMIPLLVKEGLGVVNRDANAGAHHPRTPLPPRRGATFMAAKGKWLFRVGMGAPVLDPAKIPFKAGDFPPPIRNFALRTQRGEVQATVTSMGNPHCSIFVEDFAAPIPRAAGPAPVPSKSSQWLEIAALKGGASPPAAWETLGREIETNPLFPNCTNVEFVRVLTRSEIEVRFWERGAGHTMSSGTGSCAAAVASILNGMTERQVRVRTEGGSLQVDWPENGQVILTGPVERIAQGTYNYTP